MCFGVALQLGVAPPHFPSAHDQQMTRTIEIRHCRRSMPCYGHDWTDEPLQHDYLFVSKWRDTALDEDDKAGYRTSTFCMTVTVGLSRSALSRIIRTTARHLASTGEPDDIVCYTTDPQYRLTEEHLYSNLAL